jgi:hypothetical protein
MKKVIHLSLCVTVVLSAILFENPSPSVSATSHDLPVFTQEHSPSIGPTPTPFPPDGLPYGGTASSSSEPSGRVSSLSQPFGESPLWVSQADFDYVSYTYTHSDILIFSYADDTEFEVNDSIGSLVWSGTLDVGQHQSLSPGAGVYLVSGSQPFSLVVGDQLTDYVWGYYALDQNGKGLSTLFHTYQADWMSNSLCDPHFIVFAYQDNTHVEVRDTTSGSLIWSGTLDEGQHYDNTSIIDRFLTVSSDKPVSALSYTDQGYYVPSQTGVFVGTKFYTFVGNSGDWAEDLNVIAYENTSVTIKDTATGHTIWSGTLNAGQMHTESGLNGTFVTVIASNRVTVSVSPYTSWGDRYYHSIYAQDSTGTGIGTLFTFPSIANAKLVIFSYDDDSQVTVRDAAGAVAWSGTLNQGDRHTLTSAYTLYTVTSSGQISVLLDWGDNAGAEFAPIHYAVLKVEITSPTGESYRNGETVLVTANVTQQSHSVLGAHVTGRISLPDDNYLSFDLNDTALNGDISANDGTYSARVALPGPDVLPAGNYYLFVTAQKIKDDGSIDSGTGASIFSVSGSPEGTPSVVVSVDGPTPPYLYAGDLGTIRAAVTYPDGVTRSDSVVSVIVTSPSMEQNVINLAYTGGNTWQVDYVFNSGGRYLLDVQATPPPGTSYVDGYGASVVDVFKVREELTIAPVNLEQAYNLHENIELIATVSADGLPVSEALVYAMINPDGQVVVLRGQGGNTYVGTYYAAESGLHSVTFTATALFYHPGTTSREFIVTPNSVDLLDKIDVFADSTNSSLETIDGNAKKVAQEGDWFRNQLVADSVELVADFAIGLVSTCGDVSEALETMQADGFVRASLPGIRLVKSETGIDGRLYESWSSRLTHALREELLHPDFSFSMYPKYVGGAVVKRALYSYAAKYAYYVGEESIDELTDRGVEIIVDILFEENANVLYDRFYQDVLAPQIEDDQQLVIDYAEATKTDMPSYSSAEEEVILRDLAMRDSANHEYAFSTHQRNVPLFTAYDDRQNQDPFFEILAKILLKAGLKLLVGIVFDGPGLIALSIGELAVDTYNNWQDVSEDGRMFDFALGSMGTIKETEEQVFCNSTVALKQIKQGTAPRTAKGEIRSIQDIKRGTSFLGIFFEKEALASIEIANTGDHRARFSLRTYYFGVTSWGTQFFSYWIEGAKDTTTGDEEVWITLDPGETRVIEVYFKNREGIDMRPPDGTSISYTLLANNDQGTYWADDEQNSFEPTKEILPSLAPSSESSHLRLDASAGEEIPYPISSRLITGGNTLNQIVSIQVINGFPFPIAATVYQPIPGNVAVVVPNGGSVDDNGISWQQIIQPHDMQVFSVEVVASGPMGVGIEILPAQLSFYLAEAGDTATFLADPLTIYPKVPLIVEGDIPSQLQPQGDSIIPVTITNLASTTSNGSLVLKVFDLDQTEVLNSSEQLSIAGLTSQAYNLVIPSSLNYGVYSVVISVTYQGYEQPGLANIVEKEGTALFLPLVLHDFPSTTRFDSQFNGSAPGWESHSGTWTVDSNYYSTAGLAGTSSSASYTADFNNFDYQARLWRNGCDGCANRLIIRGTPAPLDSGNNWNRSYLFQYTRNGSYSVWKAVAGSYTPLQGWTSSSAINQGSAWNTLRVVANGSSLYFYINGTLVWGGSDTSLTSGRVGIGMYRSSDSTGDRLWVDWATLSPLDASGVGAPAITNTVSAEQQALNDTANTTVGKEDHVDFAETR